MKTELENFLRMLKLRIAATTFLRKEWQIRSFWKYLLYHNIHFEEATKQTIEEYLLSLSCGQQAKEQINVVIKEFYNYTKVKNPAKNIVFRKNTALKLPKVPSQHAIQSLIRKLDNEDTLLSIRNVLILELAYGSGLRRAELIKLDIDDIDFENRTVFVQGKGGKDRVVPLTNKAVEGIRKYIAERKAWKGSLLVSYAGRRLSLQGIYQIIHDKMGIRPHQLRHACAGHMLENGCGIKVIQELLGHSDLRATQVYTQINKNKLREVINKKHPGNRKDL